MVRLACLILSALMLAGTSRTADSSDAVVSQYRITVLSTMLADYVGDSEHFSSFGEWGFAALVEADGHKFLYDTGYDSHLVLDNARKLGIDLSDVEDVILSHHHIDHIGGLITLRKELMKLNPEAMSRVHVAEGFLASRHDPHNTKENKSPAPAIVAAYEQLGGRVISYSDETEIAPGVWLTGPVPRRHDERNWSGNYVVERHGKFVEDNVYEDLSLIIETSDGLVLLSGCGHAGIVNIADRAVAITGREKVVAIIGGFHLLDANDASLAWTARNLRRHGIGYIVGAHCTGVEALYQLRELAGLSRSTAVVGAVGQTYSADGIGAGWIAR